MFNFNIAKLFALTLLAPPLAQALSVPTSTHDHAHNHEVRRSLPDTWYQPEDHAVKALFRRAPDDGNDYPPVGSPAWSARFPRSTPDPNALPQEWLDALAAAEAAGRIPDVPISSGTPNQNPRYPPGVNPTSPTVCSSTYKCRIDGDIWDGPDGVFATSFDDGPQPYTPKLLDFFQSHNLKTTHFMIGVHILAYPSQFMATLESDHDIAVHTYTHPYMTTLTNREILGQLGWTMLIIHDSTGGRVPKYWRPPYGDSDMRVRAIAKEVFGLDTVIWNRDTDDYSGNATLIADHMNQWLPGPKSPGLVVLQHETSDVAVDGFINAYPSIVSHGWDIVSVARAIGDRRVYQNAAGSRSNDVVPAGIIAIGRSDAPSSSSSSSTSNLSSTPGAATSTSFSSTSGSVTDLPTTTIGTSPQNQASQPNPAPTSAAAEQLVGEYRLLSLSVLAILLTTCLLS
ncbi:hypothetical protein CVT24_004037 [Panaeolus cyanescens]|uniref:chitin deacetylase n=1 Tax=Panaeolus cyanescens TaxID=181874 RepID=A0A409Y686_9AGAR|nr:hypothetical protein CVT24_004037 [Panaeolus cyanescens]